MIVVAVSDRLGGELDGGANVDKTVGVDASKVQPGATQDKWVHRIILIGSRQKTSVAIPRGNVIVFNFGQVMESQNAPSLVSVRGVDSNCLKNVRERDFNTLSCQREREKKKYSHLLDCVFFSVQEC